MMNKFLPLLLAVQAAISCQAQEHSKVRGVIVLARNGDRQFLHQDPVTYKPGRTDTTPLGEAQSYNLGSYLRSVYLDQSNPNHIRGIKTELADVKQIYIRSKAGGEGTVSFDSSIALLQGLYPPTQKNKIVLANDTTIVAPLGGYQYVPVETVEPANDRSLESWTDCPAFQKHVEGVYNSDEFKKRASQAGEFFRHLHDYVFGPEVSLKNYWNVHDFVNTQLIHNKTYAYRLPPTFIEQSRGLADYRENAIFSDNHIGGIGNIAGRTVLNSIIKALERIEYNGDPLQFFIQEITYHPLISLFSMLEITDAHPELKGIADFASAFAIELRHGDDGDSNAYVRFKFRNGTSDGDFKTLRTLGHRGDMLLSEFIYRTQGHQIHSNEEWKAVCNGKKITVFEEAAVQGAMGAACGGALVAFILCSALFVASRFCKKRQGTIRLEDSKEVLPTQRF